MSPAVAHESSRVRTLRWTAVGVFVLASLLNFLDRLTIAALAPVLMQELSLSARQYGWVLSAFSLTYAFSALIAGAAIDRYGIRRAMTWAVALWSLAGAATGWVTGFTSLLFARAFLGFGESAALPGSGKATAVYLHPPERSLGAAFNQAGLSAGAVLAPLLSVWLALRFGWRSVFWVTGFLGILWIPLWLYITRIAPVADPRAPLTRSRSFQLLRDPRLWTLVAANFLSMTVYTLWTNWTTIYLVRTHQLTTPQAAKYAWLPPLAATLGGFLGGTLALRAMRAGRSDIEARLWACRLAAFAMLVTGLVPFTTTPLLSTLAIGLSFFWSGCWSVNLYTLPVDVFGVANAAFGVAAITFAFGLMQTVVSPLYGGLIDRYGFLPVCVGLAALPLIAYFLLARGLRRV